MSSVEQCGALYLSLSGAVLLPPDAQCRASGDVWSSVSSMFEVQCTCVRVSVCVLCERRGWIRLLRLAVGLLRRGVHDGS